MARRPFAQTLGPRTAFLFVLLPLLSARPGDAGLLADPKQTVVLINHHLVAANQFRIGFPDACAFFHFHANNGTSVTALDGTVIPDPLPASCGYGAIGGLPPLRPWVVWVSNLADADRDGIPDSAELAGSTDPDVDGDGIPDGNEDADGDGVTRGEEYWVWGTSDLDFDSDGDGCDDGVEAALDRFYDRYVLIPVAVSLYLNSGVSLEAVLDVLVRLNQILKPMRTRFQVRMVYTDVTAGDDGSGGGTAGDGMLSTEEELEEGYYASQNVVYSLWGPLGVNLLYVANDGLLKGSTPSIGLDFGRSAAFTPRASTDLEASTLLHQAFHLFGLPDSAPPGAAFDPMNPSDVLRDNFVQSLDPKKGLLNLQFTPKQRADFVRFDQPRFVGVPGAFFSPAAKQHYQVGGAQDGLGDQTGGQPVYVDLGSIALASTEEDDDIHVSLSIHDGFPGSGAVDVAYRLLFDADANAGTGASVDGFAGIERELWLAVRGDASAGGLVVSGLVRDHADAARRYPLAGEPAILPVTQLGDATTKTEVHAEDRLDVRVRKSLLGLTATDVPVKAIASTPGGSLTSTVRDTTTFVYHQDQWQDDPTLTVPVVSADQGASVGFTIAGLAPNAAYTLLLDDTTVKSGALDFGGGASSTFTVPSNAPNGFAFLTAVDDEGGFASAAVKVVGLPFLDGFEWGNAKAWSNAVQ